MMKIMLPQQIYSGLQSLQTALDSGLLVDNDWSAEELNIKSRVALRLVSLHPSVA